MKFPYAEVKPGIFAPLLRIEIFSQEWYGFDVYVDSGASFSIFGEEVATILGIDFAKGKLIYVTVGDGGSIPIYLHKLQVKFSGKEFKAAVGFSEKLGVGFNLLGRADFFERFRICFNDKHKIIDTTWLD